MSSKAENLSTESSIASRKSAIENSKIVVRNRAGLTRRARKSELKWFADRGFAPASESEKVGREPLAPPAVK
jgi:hypothetical protein